MEIFIRAHEIIEKRVAFIIFGLTNITVDHVHNASCQLHSNSSCLNLIYKDECLPVDLFFMHLNTVRASAPKLSRKSFFHPGEGRRVLFPSKL